MKAFATNITDKFTLEYLQNQVLKNAYGNDESKIARLDPRTLLVWYLFFGIVPWFLTDVKMLFVLFIFVIFTAKAAEIAPLVMFLFGIGVFTQSGYLLIVSLFFGGDISVIIPLLILTLKVSIVSLASITVFSGLDPDKLSMGLLYFGCPEELSFSISYGFRILPVLMEEFQNILLSFRIRGRAPVRNGLIGNIKYFIYQIKIIILAFYPLMLNTAKKSRTTVEALEIKGFKHATVNPKVRKLKLRSMKYTKADGIFSIISVVVIFLAIMIS
jgi:energy-coupling factor transport system permease protein